MTRRLCICAFAAFAAAAIAGAQGTFPNLTGTWKANVSSSQFLGDAPDEMIVKIQDAGDTLALAQTEKRAGNSRTMEFKLDKTGRESLNKSGGIEVQTTLKYEPGAMLEHSNFKTPAGNFSRTSKVTVSASGKTMTKESRYVMADGSHRSDRVVLEKQ